MVSGTKGRSESGSGAWLPKSIEEAVCRLFEWYALEANETKWQSRREGVHLNFQQVQGKHNCEKCYQKAPREQSCGMHVTK
eukprot:848514-Amphidinium_carterae.1